MKDKDTQLIWEAYAESWADDEAKRPSWSSGQAAPINWYKDQQPGDKVPLLTPDQDKTIKEIYLKISPFIDEFVRVRSTISPPPRSAPEVFKAMDWSNLSVTPGQNRRIQFDSADISRWQTVFPDIEDTFYILIEGSMNHRAGLASVHRSETGRKMIMGIELNWDDILPGKETRVKASVQHELQHLVKSGEEGTDDRSTVAKGIQYMTGEDEVRSTAKEAAYYFSKMVPGDPTFDYNKLIAAGVNPEDIIKYYYLSQLFNDPNKRAETMQKHNLDPSFDTIMKDAGEKFVRYVQQFLTNSYHGER